MEVLKYDLEEKWFNKSLLVIVCEPHFISTTDCGANNLDLHRLKYILL